MSEIQPPVAPDHPYRVRGSVSLECPADWGYKESLTLLAPDGTANIIVSVEPLSPGMSSAEYANLQGDLLSTEFTGFDEHSFGVSSILGLPVDAYIRDFSWEPAGMSTVRQIQLYAVVQDRGVTITCTTPESSFNNHERDMREVLDQLRVDEAQLRDLGVRDG